MRTNNGHILFVRNGLQLSQVLAAGPEGAESVLSKALYRGKLECKHRKLTDDDEEETKTLVKTLKF
jgi:hypothetical protein